MHALWKGIDLQGYPVLSIYEKDTVTRNKHAMHYFDNVVTVSKANSDTQQILFFWWLPAETRALLEVLKIRVTAMFMVYGSKSWKI